MSKGASNKASKPVHPGILEPEMLPVQNYYIRGRVVHGNHLGSSLGFPTANIQTLADQPKMIPNGVYLVSVMLQERKFFGLCNIGLRPTIGGKHLVIEVNILDFSEDIYGKEISVSVLRIIRKEKKFQNLDQLVNQIRLDKIEALKLLSLPDKDQPG
jgi:riboflavin kinase/FMN adenylyltransferase